MTHAGRLRHYLNAWRSITHDQFILDTVQGYRIPFKNKPQQLSKYPAVQIFSKTETVAVDKEIKHLLEIQAIQKCLPSKDQFVSKIFLTPKSDGSMRFILNLKRLNKFVQSNHFKMEDVRTAVRLMSPNCFMGKIDLKEAYFLVPVHSQDRKFLRFYHKELYEFTALPFGLCSAPYIFTKLIQPIVSHLRSKGFLSVRYLDDFLCLGNSYGDCLNNINETVKCLTDLGFIINYDKSVLIPNKSCNFLGYVLNSGSMTMELPNEKRHKITHMLDIMIDHLVNRKNIRIREFAKYLGTLISACPAIPYSWLYTKSLERAKYIALLRNGNSYDRFMIIPSSLHEDLLWWKLHSNTAVQPIQATKYSTEIFTDASTTGWGASCSGCHTGGFWTKEEQSQHINYLELLAVYFGLMSFAKNKNNCHILMRVDNTTAISYVNRMGGIQYPHLNRITRLIWKWCEERNIVIFASYIRSAENIDADRESRNMNVDTEWEISADAFAKITSRYGVPDIDLFATRVNSKCTAFISWKPDPYAQNIDAFTVDWNIYNFYAFPPFSLILKTLNKIISDRAQGIVVVPYWPSQPWFPLFKLLCVEEMFILPPDKNLLSSSFRRIHPLHQHLSLAVSVLSGRRS